MFADIRDPRIPSILTQMRWYARPERFVLVGLDPQERLVVQRVLSGISSPFVQLLFEPDVITLLLPETDWRTLRPAFPRARVQQPYRLISFDLDLPADLVGFLALITAALAQAGISLLAVCGYSKDHVLVREEQLDSALQQVAELVAQAKRSE